MANTELKPFSLTPAEWLCLFPRNAAKGLAHFPDSLSSPNGNDVEEGTEHDFDPADELRQQFPVDRKTLDATLEALDARGLAFLNKLSDIFAFFVGPQSYGTIILSVIWNILVLGTFSMIWRLNEGEFGPPQLIAGTISMCLICVFQFVAITAMALQSYHSGMDNDALVAAPLLQLVRWHQLASGKLGGTGDTATILATQDASKTDGEATFKDALDFAAAAETTSLPARLLDHIPNDPQCPCKQCFVDLPREIFWERMARSISIQLSALISFVMLGFSSFVRSAFWEAWWGLFLGITFLVFCVCYNVVSLYEKWHQPSAPLMKLRSRLNTRASWLALRSFLERAKAELRAPPDGSLNPPDTHETELVVRLHARYITMWTQSPHTSAFTAVVLTMGPAIIVICAVINAVGFFGWFFF
jgi:hypothetical protein